MIYFDNSATSLVKPESVYTAVLDAMKTFGGSGRGAHNAAMNAARCIFEAREEISLFFNGYGASNTVFTQNATEALNIAIFGTVKKGSHVITTENEHNSVLRPLFYLEDKGDITLSVVKGDKNGVIDPKDIEKEINDKTSLVVCNHVSNVIGNKIDIFSVGDICKKHNVPFIVDVSQSAGVFDIDMRKNNISVLCFTGHKSLLGPQGTGGLCVKDDFYIAPFKQGGSGVQSFKRTQPENMPERLEAGTVNGHGIAGLLAGIRYIKNYGLDNIFEKEKQITKMFYDGIKDFKNVKIYGDFSTWDRGAVVGINIGDIDSAIISDILNTDFDICTRAGAHCAPLVHKHFNTENQGIVRFSFSHFNTEEEIKKAIEAIYELNELYEKGEI